MQSESRLQLPGAEFLLVQDIPFAFMSGYGMEATGRPTGSRPVPAASLTLQDDEGIVKQFQMIPLLLVV
jgi:hypothetical protein